MANWKTKKLRADNITELLSLLQNHKELTFKQLKEKLQVSDPTLNEYIKALLETDKIEAFTKTLDRRNTWYRIKPEKASQVTGSVGKYEALKFIKSIHNPVYHYKPEGDKAIAAIGSVPATVNRKEFEKKFKNAIDKMARFTFPLNIKAPGQKVAIVIMISSEDLTV